MRRTRLITALLLTTLAIAGCGDGGTGPVAVGPGTMTARIDGNAFVATAALARFCATCLALGQSEGIEIIGVDARGGIGLFLFGSAGEGAYNLTGSERGAAVADIGDGDSYATNLEGGSGTVQVTRRTTDEIEGVFSFTGVVGPGGRSIRVTDGRFNVRIQ